VSDVGAGGRDPSRPYGPPRVIDRVCVYGLWHLGCVTAACLAAEGMPVMGLDLDRERIAALRDGRPPIAEPGLAELIQAGLAARTLQFTDDPSEALSRANVLWIAFDTPVDDDDRADPAWVRGRLEAIRPAIRDGTLVIVSSQVPVGFTAALERAWRRTDPSLRFACAPENLRLGRAIEAFRQPERVVLGLGEGTDREVLADLFQPFCGRIEWMTLHSAEMTKHALNGFLALSVAYTNELARICERVGADASEVERGLRSEPRVGPRAYVSPGSPIAGGTLARDVAFLAQLAAEHGQPSPIMDAIRASNRLHQAWARERVLELAGDIGEPRVALLGLTYKPGTDTLRRSSALELGRWLAVQGFVVRAYDPAIQPVSAYRDAPLLANVELAASLDEALRDADVAVLATAWPEFRALQPDDFVRRMRHPRLVDEAGFLPHLADDPRLTYVRVGRPISREEVER